MVRCRTVHSNCKQKSSLRAPPATVPEPGEAVLRSKCNAPGHIARNVLLDGRLQAFSGTASEEFWEVACSPALAAKTGSPFNYSDGGPGGWWIIDKPELHLGENSLPKRSRNGGGDMNALHSHCRQNKFNKLVINKTFALSMFLAILSASFFTAQTQARQEHGICAAVSKSIREARHHCPAENWLKDYLVTHTQYENHWYVEMGDNGPVLRNMFSEDIATNNNNWIGGHSCYLGTETLPDGRLRIFLFDGSAGTSQIVDSYSLIVYDVLNKRFENPITLFVSDPVNCIVYECIEPWEELCK
ncbi:MAG: hypothetical protein OXF56_25940 [Rhodobacteraceae bacterium]|nr:hypothetical protein [Paracoccaceae bacterium]